MSFHLPVLPQDSTETKSPPYGLRNAGRTPEMGGPQILGRGLVVVIREKLGQLVQIDRHIVILSA